MNSRIALAATLHTALLFAACPPRDAQAGEVYLRSPSVAYVPNQAGDAVPGTQLIVAGKSLVADGGGRFDPGIATLATGQYASIAASKAGYLNLSTRLFYDETPFQDFNIGMYPETAVVPRPGFVKGVFTMDVGGFMPGTFAQGLFEPAYDRIRRNTGANLIAISDPVWVEAYDAAKATVTMSKTSTIPMLTRAQYTQLVTAAHARGMQFLMQLSVYPAGSLQLPWSVDSADTAFWDAWFAAYRPIVVEYATIARDLGIEYVALTFNNGFMTRLPASYWSNLVAAVRAAGYSGKLVAQLFSNLDIPGGEWVGVNGACCGPDAESKRLEFVKLFDAIVIDVNNVALGRTAPQSISRDEMKAGFRWLLDQLTAWPVPVMIMLATPSVYGGAVNPEYIEPCLACGSVAPSRQRDTMQQADAYQALFEVINATPTGPGRVMGVLSWGYWFTDDPFKWVDGGVQPMAYDKSASIRGKPAESVMRWWFNDQVVEFYNAALDNYFITANANETGAVDNGAAGPGWTRTGGIFKSGGPTAVCRFYGSIAPGPNSHFYTADPAECAALKAIQAATPATEKRWNFESLDFLTAVPVAGNCPSGMSAVRRAYNNGAALGKDSNHRIATNAAAIQEVVSHGWRDEGVVMCAPQ